MNAHEAGRARPAAGRIAQQIPAFAAIGLLGYFVDAGVTSVSPNIAGLSPEFPGRRASSSPRSSITSSTGR